MTAKCWKFALIISIAAVTIAAVAVPRAEEPTAGPIPTRSAAIAQPGVAAGDAAPEPLSPRMQEIRLALDRQKDQLADLHVRFAAAGDDATALAVQQEIERVKQETQLEVFRIQLRYAQQSGHDAALPEIEAAIAACLDPDLDSLQAQDSPRNDEP